MRALAVKFAILVGGVLLALSLAGQDAFAQAAGRKPVAPAAPVYQRTRVYDFHQDPIDGKKAAPSGSLVSAVRLRHGKGLKVAQLPRAIAKLEKKLKKALGSAAEAKLRAHLAELYLLRARAAERERFRAFDRAHQSSSGDALRKKKLLERSKQQQQRAQAWTRKALEQYSLLYCDQASGSAAVLKTCRPNPRFLGYKQLDHVLFVFAHTLQSEQRGADARRVWQRLIARHARSALVGHAYLALADYNYGENLLRDAARLYDLVLASKPAVLHPYALYRKGWLELSLGQPKRAMSSFRTVVRIGRTKKRHAALAKEAAKDYVRAFAGGGNAGAAYDAFRRLDARDALELLARLGTIYADQGKAGNALAVFAELRTRAPGHRSSCRWQSQITEVRISGFDQPAKLRAIRAQIALHQRLSRRKSFPKKALDRCYRDTEATARKLATLWRREASKTLNSQTLGHADKLYSSYLAAFAGAKDYGMTRYYHAELIWTLAESEKNQAVADKLWQRAAQAHAVVAKDRTLTAKLRKESAYAAVLAWKNALRAVPARPLPRPASLDPLSRQAAAASPLAIPKSQRQLLAAFAAYRTHAPAPEETELVTMRFLEARIYWRYQHFSKAVPLLVDILDKHREHDTAGQAVELLLDSLLQARRYKDLRAWANKVLGMPAFLKDKPELAKRLAQLSHQGKRKDAEQLERAGKFDACSRLYLELYNANPTAPGAHELLYNAGVCAEQAGSVGPALHAYTLLRSRFPGHAVSKKALIRSANLYARIAWYYRAAQLFEQYALRFAGEKNTPTALRDAFYYYRQTGALGKALRVAQTFMKFYHRKSPREVATLSLSLTEIYQTRGDLDGAIKNLRFYLKAHARRGGIDRRLIAHSKLGTLLWKKACRRKTTVAGLCAAAAKPAAAKQCGRAGRSRLRIAQRVPALVTEAHRQFAIARKLYRGGRVLDRVPPGPNREARQQRMKDHIEEVKLLLADARLESYLSGRTRGLRGPALDRFSQQERAHLGALAPLYQDVERTATRPGSALVAAASARLALLYQQSGHRMASVASSGKRATVGLCVHAVATDKLAAAAARRCLGAPTMTLAAAPDAYAICQSIARDPQARTTQVDREKTGPTQARTPFSSIEPAVLRYPADR